MGWKTDQSVALSATAGRMPMPPMATKTHPMRVKRSRKVATNSVEANRGGYTNRRGTVRSRNTAPLMIAVSLAKVRRVFRISASVLRLCLIIP